MPIGELGGKPRLDPGIEDPARLRAVVPGKSLQLSGRANSTRAASRPARVRSSTKLCADSVTTAAQRSGHRAAVAIAIPPPTLWPNGTIMSRPNASHNRGTDRRGLVANERQRQRARCSSDRPKPNRSYATTGRRVATASCSGKSRGSDAPERVVEEDDRCGRRAPRVSWNPASCEQRPFLRADPVIRCCHGVDASRLTAFTAARPVSASQRTRRAVSPNAWPSRPHRARRVARHESVERVVRLDRVIDLGVGERLLEPSLLRVVEVGASLIAPAT